MVVHKKQAEPAELAGWRARKRRRAQGPMARKEKVKHSTGVGRTHTELALLHVRVALTGEAEQNRECAGCARAKRVETRENAPAVALAPTADGGSPAGRIGIQAEA